jgi:type IV pilus assembly protein PilE
MKMQRSRPSARHIGGVSLIELLTVLTIVAILGSLAVGAYGRYSLRANRTDAKAALLRIQVAEEKFFLGNNTYTTDFTSAPPTGLGVQPSTNTSNLRYAITLAAGSSGSIASSYLATATAINGQLQDDSTCQVLTINDRGDRTPADSTGCWR